MDKKGKTRDLLLIIVAVVAIIGLVVALKILIEKQKIDEENNSQNIEITQTNNGEKNKENTGVRINEVSSEGWVELYNSSTVDIDISSYSFLVGNEVYEVKKEISVEPKDFYSIRVADSIAVNNKESISFLDENLNVIQSIYVPVLNKNESYFSIDDSGKYYVIGTSSINKSNAGSTESKIYNPTYLLPEGFYKEDQVLLIRVPENTKVYYTMDGEEPTDESVLYNPNEGIALTNASKNANVYSARTDLAAYKQSIPASKVNKANIVKAIAIGDDGKKSEIVSATYFVGIGETEMYSNFPVYSIITKPDDLFDYWNGIYVKGVGYDNAVACGISVSSASNYFNGRRIDATVESYNSNHVKDNEIVCNLSVFCDSSANSTQKSLLMETSDEKIILSSGGVDSYYKMRNYILNNFATNEGLISQTVEPCIVFLDGEYWGVYLKSEVIDSNYISKIVEADSKDIQYISYRGSSSKEVYKEWGELKDYIMTMDMTDADCFSYVKNQIDLEQLAQTYCFNIFFGNYDYSSDKWYVYRNIKGNDSRWHFVIADMSDTLGVSDRNKYSINTFIVPDISEDYVLYSLMRNKEFLEIFNTSMSSLAKNVDSYDISTVLSYVSGTYGKGIIASYERFVQASSMDVYSSYSEYLLEYFKCRWDYLEKYTNDFCELYREKINWQLLDGEYVIVSEVETDNDILRIEETQVSTVDDSNNESSIVLSDTNG